MQADSWQHKHGIQGGKSTELLKCKNLIQAFCGDKRGVETSQRSWRSRILMYMYSQLTSLLLTRSIVFKTCIARSFVFPNTPPLAETCVYIQSFIVSWRGVDIRSTAIKTGKNEARLMSYTISLILSLSLGTS